MADPVTLLKLTLNIFELVEIATRLIERVSNNDGYLNPDKKIDPVWTIEYQTATQFLATARSSELDKEQRELFLVNSLELLILSYSRFEQIKQFVQMGEISFNIAVVFVLLNKKELARKWYQQAITDYQLFHIGFNMKQIEQLDSDFQIFCDGITNI